MIQEFPDFADLLDLPKCSSCFRSENDVFSAISLRMSGDAEQGDNLPTTDELL